MSPKTDLVHVPLKDIRVNPKLRLRVVKKDTEDYLTLVDSIREKGVLNAISVRRVENPDPNGPQLYELVDGGNRTMAANDAGLETIPAQVMDIDDVNVLEAQIVANIHKVETRHAEYAKQLQQILRINPDLTERELARRLGVSLQTLQDKMGLSKLSEKAQKLVNDGHILLSNAVALSKIPEKMQDQFLERAQTEPTSTFAPSMDQLRKQIAADLRSGRDPNAKKEYVHQARLQTLADIKGTYEAPAAFAAQLIIAEKASTPEQIVKATLAWVLKSDSTTVAALKAKWEAAEAAREETNKKAKAERDEKKRLAAAANVKEEGLQPLV